MYAKSLTVFLALALSVAAGPHAPRDSSRHHALAARVAAPAPAPVPEPIVVEDRAPAASASNRMVRKRSNARRCKVRSSTSVALSSTATASTATAAASAIVNVGSDPATTSESSSSETSSAADTETSSATPTTSAKPSTSATPTTSEKPSTSATPSTTHTTAAPTTTEAATTTHKTTSSTKVTATKTSSAASSTFTQSFLVGTQTGQGTFYGTGLGACGITNTDTDYIAAVSHLLFDVFPGYDGANPNNNPICNKKVTATYKGKSVSVAITDRCTACAVTDLDFSPSAFDQLADESLGRLSGMTWVWDDL